MRAALYVRVSTADQAPENQLLELRRYAQARGWTTVEFVDHGVSGTKDRRPALDALLKDAKRRRFDLVAVWRLDRLGRNLRHLLTVIDELAALGVGFVTLGEGIDTTTPAGRLQLHVLSAISQFERDRIAERVRAGLERARSQGKRLGRPRAVPPLDRLSTVAGLPLSAAAAQLRVSRSTLKRWRKAQKTLSGAA
jgi:DNA invertase Pin-like site-specific DNA recombinase